MLASVPFDQAYWVVSPHFMAGCYPGAENPGEVFQNISGLINCGIRNIINLMKPDERNQWGRSFIPYEPQVGKIAASIGTRVVCDRMTIKDMWIPSRPEMGRILDRIDASIRSNNPVYLHCLGGIGRTGTVVGCYLARHGYASGHKIISVIQDLRAATVNRHRSSPETNQQIDLVLSWVEGE